ncbi:MAG TPA: EamA family transporter, partial [Chthonomonadales bacterium]|nr:EamA family transporter [Chthonomonadales bacterium]
YLAAAPLLYLPLFLYFLPRSAIPPLGWLCIAATGVVYFGYFVGLAVAYRENELSFAYPLIRGLGPALAFVGGIFLLSEQPTVWGSCGVGLILAGVIVLNWRGGKPGSLVTQFQSLATPSTRAALFVGLMYCFYSLIDKVGVGRLHVNPPVYIYLTYMATALLVVPWVLWRRGVKALWQEWRANSHTCLAVGGLNLLAYLMVLYAMSLPNTPVSYIVPLRTTSVLIGVLLGVGVLGEGRLPTKMSVAFMVMAGIALMTWKG